MLSMMASGLLAVAAFGTPAQQAAAQGAAVQHTEAPVEKLGSVVGLDVYAHAGLIDVVFAAQAPEGVALFHRRSRDGGAHWTADSKVDMHGIGISMAMRGLDPQVAAAGERVFVVWTSPGEGAHGVGALATALSDDGGATWRPGINPADDGTQRGHAFLESMADAAGTLHVVWLENRGTRGLQAATSSDFGKTWAPTRTVDAVTCECCWNKLLSLKPGEAHVLYRDKDPRDMAIAYTADAGKTWERLATVGDYKWGIEACPFTGGGLTATGATGEEALHVTVYSGEKSHRGITYLASSDRGRSWTLRAQLSEAAQHSDLASVGSRLVTIYDELVEGSRVVSYRASDDAGRTWSAPRRLSSSGVEKADFPRLVAAQGRFVGLWTEKDTSGMVHLRVRPID